MGKAPLSEVCKNCAECCRHYSWVALSEKDIAALEKFTGLSSEAFADPKGTTVDEYFLKFKNNGDCYFLGENDGDFSCGVYEARSDICRSYPSKPSQDAACDANQKMCLSNDSGPAAGSGVGESCTTTGDLAAARITMPEPEGDDSREAGGHGLGCSPPRLPGGP